MSTFTIIALSILAGSLGALISHLLHRHDDNLIEIDEFNRFRSALRKSQS